MNKNSIEDPEEVWANIMEDDWRMERRDKSCSSNLALVQSHPIIKRIRRVGVLHDYGDILEHGVEVVLEWYGLLGGLGRLPPREAGRIEAAVTELGETMQTQEIVRQVLATAR